MSLPRDPLTSLMDWYRLRRRDLPWRRTSDPYAIWVSEVMLQQTRVEAVIPYYRRWMETFPDAAALAAAPEERVLKLWEGLGYYSRARHLQQAARRVVEEHGGRLPADPGLIRRLPGVGEYIAAALLSIAFGLPEAAVDGNVVRVAARLLADGADSTTPAFRRRIKALLEESFHGYPPGEVNQAWMELGALVCRPKPACGVCPLQAHCRAHALGRETDFPVKPARRAAPQRWGIILWLEKEPGGAEAGGTVSEAPGAASPAARAAAPGAAGSAPASPQRPLLLVRRASRGLLGGLWELPNWLLAADPGGLGEAAGGTGAAAPQPGGRRTGRPAAPAGAGPFEPDRLEAFCRARGIRLLADTGIEVRHSYSHFSVVYRIWRAGLQAAERPLAGWVEQRWVPPGDLPAYPRPRVHILAMERLGLAALSTYPREG